MRSLAIEVLDKNVGRVWLERDTIVSVDDVAISDGYVGASVDIPSICKMSEDGHV